MYVYIRENRTKFFFLILCNINALCIYCVLVQFKATFTPYLIRKKNLIYNNNDFKKRE